MLNAEWNLQILGMEKVCSILFTIKGNYYGTLISTIEIPNDGYVSRYAYRKISLVIFLNDPEEYEGGELESRNLWTITKRKKCKI